MLIYMGNYTQKGLKLLSHCHPCEKRGSKNNKSKMRYYYVYMMASSRNGTIYVGVTRNLIKRVYEHKNNLVEGFTEKYKVHHLFTMNLLRTLIKLSQEKNR